MTLAIQTLFSSLVNTAVYVLIGLGIVLCYRSSRIVNLVQGETYSISGLFASKLVLIGVPLAAAGVSGVAAAIVTSLLLERVALRSRLRWDPRRLIIVTVGIAILIEGVLQILLGPDTYNLPAMLSGGSLLIAGAAISQQGVLAIAVACAATLVLVLFFKYSVLGRAMTASAENPRASEVLGINVARMRQLSYGIAGALGGLTALLLVPLTGVSSNAGFSITLNGFLAAAFANMMYPGRVLWAGLGIGICEGIVGTYWNSLWEVPVVLGGVLLVGVALLSRGVRFGGAQRA